MHKYLKKSKHQYQKILFAVMGVLIITVLFVIFFKPKADTDEDILWREYPVTQGTITASLDGGGTLKAAGIQHSFDVELKIQQIMVEIGDEVKAGDLLAQYDLEDLEKKKEELEDSLETAQRALEDARNNRAKAQLQEELAANGENQSNQSAYERQRREIENAIRTSEQKVQQLETKLDELYQDLEEAETSDDGSVDSEELGQLKEQLNALQEQIAAKEGVIASLREQIGQAESALESTLFDLETQYRALEALDDDHEEQTEQNKENQQTQGKINSLTNASLDNAVENAQAQVEKIRNQIAAAKEAANTPTLIAKADGVVTEVNFKEGDQVPGGKSIVTIGDSGEKLVIVQVPQEDIADIAVGQEVEMQFLADPDNTLKGQVREKSLAPTPGADSIVYQVKIAFDEPQPELLEGMSCSVKFVLKQVTDVLTLPNKAIQLKDGKQFVTVLLPDGSHEEREIKTGFSNGRVSEITSGLAEGDIVVVEG